MLNKHFIRHYVVAAFSINKREIERDFSTQRKSVFVIGKGQNRSRTFERFLIIMNSEVFQP